MKEIVTLRSSTPKMLTMGAYGRKLPVVQVNRATGTACGGAHGLVSGLNDWPYGMTWKRYALLYR